MKRLLCDTKKGIAASLNTYEALYQLTLARQRHSRSDESDLTDTPCWHLHEFVVLGRFYLDAAGQCQKLSRSTFTDEDRKAMPPVMTREEFSAYLKATKASASIHVREGTGVDYGRRLRPPHVVCARCGQNWTLENCHDFDSTREFETLSLDRHAGKTFAAIQKELNRGTDAVRVFNRDVSGALVISQSGKRRSQFVSTTSAESGGRKGGQRAEKGMEASLTAFRFYHGACFKQKRAADEASRNLAEAARFELFLEDSGFTGVMVTPAEPPDNVFGIGAAKDAQEARAEGMPYWSVTTEQGSFGFCQIGHVLVLTLAGSGVTAKEIIARLPAEEFGGEQDQPDAEDPFEAEIIPLLGGEDDVARVLLELLLEKRIAS